VACFRLNSLSNQGIRLVPIIVRYLIRVLGPELIPVFRQLATGDSVIDLGSVGCCYMVTLAATQHHPRPLAGIKLYYLVMKTSQMCEQLAVNHYRKVEQL